MSPQAGDSRITAEELLQRAERDERLTVAELEWLLARQGTPRSPYTVREWLRVGRVPYRKLEGRDGRVRDTVWLSGRVVLQVLAWQRREIAARAS